MPNYICAILELSIGAILASIIPKNRTTHLDQQSLFLSSVALSQRVHRPDLILISPFLLGVTIVARHCNVCAVLGCILSLLPSASLDRSDLQLHLLDPGRA